MASEHDADAVVSRIKGDLPNVFWTSDIQLVLECLKPGDRLPGGGVWMPEEPTEAMLSALNESALCIGDSREGYRAMLAASGDT